MPGMRSDGDDALARRLERLSKSLGTPSETSETPSRAAPVGEPRLALRGTGVGGAAVGIALIAVAVATGNLALLIPGGLLLLAGAALALLGFARATASDPLRAKIGAGADIAADAVIEPGATVEMGVTIGAGARVCRGAIVRMGATVEAGATIGEDAVVGWGVDVKEGAVVEHGARISAGATVKPRAVVPAGMRLPPGSDWTGNAASGTPPAIRASDASPLSPAGGPPATAGRDPRLERIDAACQRIATELAAAPPSVRGFLGASAESAVGLRTVCLQLIERERMLRAECSEAAIAALEQERAQLQQRVEAATDARVRQSLAHAVKAIDDQRSQRLALRTNAERLDAELTRLQWTLDGIATQMVRLRTSGAELGAGASDEIVQTVQQLHDEVDAITEALEGVSGRGDAGIEPIAEIEPTRAHRPGERDRSR